jgi:hypothetical protein
MLIDEGFDDGEDLLLLVERPNRCQACDFAILSSLGFGPSERNAPHNFSQIGCSEDSRW